MRTIDADALAQRACVKFCTASYYSDVLKLINDQPTVDAVEVVRCKDCIHWYMDADSGTACGFTNLSQPEDGYCNFGERRKMNREQCIERLEAFRDYLTAGNPIWDVDECREAFDTAIEAMKKMEVGNENNKHLRS